MLGFMTETNAAWAQVVVGVMAALLTLLAVLIAVLTSTASLRTALNISARERDERQTLRQAYAGTLAAAFVEELWENASRAHTIHNMSIVFPEDESLCRYLVHMQQHVEAPVLEGALSRLDVFEVEDAKLFARCAVKISQLRRTAMTFERNISLNFWKQTVKEIELATSLAPELLDEGLARAHAISGVPVVKPAPAEAGAILE